jgi:uncharacterized protein YggL (DUF469 family)
MRGRKRLRKKLKNRKIAKSFFDVSLEFGARLPEGAVNLIVEQFKTECLKPADLLFYLNPTGFGLNGTIDKASDCALTEEHRGLVADWAFLQEEIDSYCVGHLIKK